MSCSGVVLVELSESLHYMRRSRFELRCKVESPPMYIRKGDCLYSSHVRTTDQCMPPNVSESHDLYAHLSTISASDYLSLLPSNRSTSGRSARDFNCKHSAVDQDLSAVRGRSKSPDLLNSRPALQCTLRCSGKLTDCASMLTVGLCLWKKYTWLSPTSCRAHSSVYKHGY